MSQHVKRGAFCQHGLAVCGDWVSFASGEGGDGVGTERANDSGLAAAKKIQLFLQRATSN